MSNAIMAEVAKVISDLAPVDTKGISSDIKSTLLFRTDWETLLMSAPIALGALGACCVAASAIDRIELRKPGDPEFRFMRHDDVSTNLMQCVDEGRLAFDNAHGGLGEIGDRVNIVDKTVIRIISTLVDPRGSKDNLLDYMEELRAAAEYCAAESKGIDDKFDHLLELIMELSQACQRKLGLTKSEIADTNLSLEAEKVRLKGQERATAAAEELSKRMDLELTVTREAYQKASNEFPSGWDVVGQQIVAGLADCVTTVVNTAIPVLMEQLSPMKKVSAATNILGDLTKDAVNAAGSIQNGLNKANDEATGAAPVQSVAQFVADPAFSAARKDMIWFNMLKEVVPVEAGADIDWDKAQSKPEDDSGKSKGKNTISIIAAGFANAVQAFSQLATDSEASEKYATALEEVNKVVAGIKQEAIDNEEDATHSRLTADDMLVREWKKAFAEQYQSALELYSAGTSFPGNSPNGFPALKSTAAAGEKDMQKSLGVMEGATNRLRMTRDAYIATQKNYLESERILIESRTKMADIQANLSKFQSSSLHLKAVLEILKESVRLVATMKKHIAKLCYFFDAMARLIKVMVEQLVQPFIKNLDTNLQKSDNGLVGAHSWADSQKQAVYQSIVTIRSYFSAYGEVSAMWVKLSGTDIIPGMELLADVFATALEEGGAAAKARELQQWSTKAQSNIEKIAKETQAKLKADMQSRVDRFAKETARLPEPPKEAVEGLKAASKVVASTAKKMLEDVTVRPGIEVEAW
ncbi:hypothetical protein N657DRAFT_685322 [Parathielavia appendiculata]|uniref:Uncharacterized protein n=1 Tax=Parathielavia appendiculata TaxID=2587402 RepID=A0AAN6YYF1_9PEZI|nr:hypothetical protein N657DRAFT_685322 [Parathielavia appendiculata]